MGRFEDAPDPAFWRLNSSIGFDHRLASYDVKLSLAHVRGLGRIGVLDDDEVGQLVAGLEEIRGEIERQEFVFEPADEDVHMGIERRLTALIGALGGKVHTARSRNDQVATDLAMFVADHSRIAQSLCRQLMATVLELAEGHRDWPVPAYTHLQRAQPVYLGHHLLTWFWMLARDVARFEAAAQAASVMPLGAGALAGLNWPVDRDGIAEELGFGSWSPNSIDAVSNRDFALDYLYAAAACAGHLSRLGSEIVIWSSAEFGFCEPAEEFSSGSSIMPQKKNPDAAELLRAKAPRVSAALTTLLGVTHALPLAYSKDLQEDKEPVFDACETIEVCLEAAVGLMAGIRYLAEPMALAAADEMPAATDVADLLVRKGMPFREAHGVVGSLVRKAIERGCSLSQLPGEVVEASSDLLGADYYALFADRAWIESKDSPGGTGSARLSEQIEAARKLLAELSA